MASRTQLRLGQITGSFGDVEGGIIDTRSASSATDVANITLVSGSLVGVLSEIASSVLRVHGHDTFASNAFSTLKDLDGDSRITYAQGAGTTLHQDDGTEVLSVAGAGARLGVTGSFFPEANRTRTLGSTTLQFLEIHGDLTGSVNGSVAGTGITNDQVVISNNGTLEGDSNFTFNGSTLTLGGSTALSVGGNVTITGNLDVNGTTTTIDTTNLSVQDSIIGLGVSGSGVWGTTGDRGILFARGAAGALLPSFYYSGDDSIFQLGLSATAPDSGSFTDPVHDPNNGILNHSTLRLGKVQFGDANSFIGGDAGTGNLILKSGDAEVVLSSSAGSDIVFKSNTSELLRLDSSYGHTLVGELRISGQNGSTPGSLVLRDNDSSNNVALKAPADITGNYDLVLPGAIGSGNQVLRLNSGATALEFADVSAAGNTKKAVRVISSAILPEANVDMDTNEADHSDFAAGALAGLVGSPNVVDVFVNGQLMTTGSVAQITAAERDYRITTGNILVFSFGLEADDVVQVITRG